jgi:NADH-quinone oxidoreductase subunit G
MPAVIIDGREVQLAANERLNGIQVAARVGIQIPHYCWHAGLTVVASCRMCLVECGRKDPQSGQIQMQPKLLPACQTPATDGTVFVTDSEKVRNARAMVEEDLLIRHPIDCPICDKAGECSLQDYHFLHGRDMRRADIQPFTSRRRELGETVTLFVDRCVMCSRCVRFCREVAGTSELMVTNRGSHEEIDVFPGYPLTNKLSGCVVDLCPVGALGDRDFLYQQRVWFLRSQPHVCAGCATGCSIQVEENQDRIYRLKPRENPHINKWWMCDEGRYGWKYVHDEQRVTEPSYIEAGQATNIDWPQLPDELDARLSGGKHLAAVLSPQLTVEEAYLLARYVRGLDARAVLAVGHVPVVGQDESFPGGFVIRAEKCPNRRGVEEIVRHFCGDVLSWEEWLDGLRGAAYDAVWITGGYPTVWHDEELAARFSDVPMLVVQDCFESPLWRRATFCLPGAAFAEREGSFVNHAGRLQSFAWAIRSPAGVMVEGHLYWRLLRRTGLYAARQALVELAREAPYFSAAVERVGVAEHGVQLGGAPSMASTAQGHGPDA